MAGSMITGRHGVDTQWLRDYILTHSQEAEKELDKICHGLLKPQSPPLLDIRPAVPPNPSQTVPLIGDEAFKHYEPMGAHS